MSNIVFFGTPAFAVPALQALADSSYRPVAVVTAPDKPQGRKRILTPSPVALEAERLGIQVLKPSTLKDDAFWGQFEALGASLCVVVAYGKLIPERLLTSVPKGWLNIHPSLLPAYRGPSPIPSAILDGQTTTGVSIMLLDTEQDHGPVLATSPWNIPGTATTPECEVEIARVGAQLLLSTLPAYLNGSCSPVAQDDSKATFTKKFTREDGRIDWSQSAHAIVNRIRALGTNPGTWTTWEGKTLNIFRAHAQDRDAAAPGGVHRDGDALIVACGAGSLVLERVQLEGSTQQDIATFLRGHPSLADGMLV